MGKSKLLAIVSIVMITIVVVADCCVAGLTLILSWIVCTLVTSDGPFTNILLINHARFVGDHIFVIP
jgi:hypothetical protein